MESISSDEFTTRPALIFSRWMAVLVPEPLPQPMGDEVVHLPKAAVVVGEGKVVAPATAHLVHFAHDLAGFFPGGVVPG